MQPFASIMTFTTGSPSYDISRLVDQREPFFIHIFLLAICFAAANIRIFFLSIDDGMFLTWYFLFFDWGRIEGEAYIL